MIQGRNCLIATGVDSGGVVGPGTRIDRHRDGTHRSNRLHHISVRIRCDGIIPGNSGNSQGVCFAYRACSAFAAIRSVRRCPLRFGRAESKIRIGIVHYTCKFYLSYKTCARRKLYAQRSNKRKSMFTAQHAKSKRPSNLKRHLHCCTITSVAPYAAKKRFEVSYVRHRFLGKQTDRFT